MFNFHHVLRWPQWKALTPSIKNTSLVGNSFPSDLIHRSSVLQRRFSFALCFLIVLTTICLAPFAQVSLPSSPAFIPIYQTAVIGTCLITAYLMYGHYTAIGTIALLHLSAGYLYTAIIMILQFLSFPAMFTESERLIGGAQTTTWLWFFWHLGPAVSI